ncbi:MAG: hypothetical protein VX834_02030, partial [Myxococcota bacterium]|nr:hypothetical protein [Myxococcota bacterium]
MTSSSDRPESWTQLLARPEEAVSSEELARHLQNLIQVFPYLDESSQAALSHALASSPMAKSRELGAVWADTAYGVATTACRAALLSISSQDTLHPDTLGRAAHYVKLLQVEDQLMVQPDHERTASQAQPEDLVPATAPLTHQALVAHIAKANFSGTLREATQNAGYSPVLASDCDGTTWSGDIGEDFFDAAIEDRWFEPEALPLINAFGTRIGIAPFNDATEGARTLQAMHASGDLALRGEKHGIDK